MLLDLKLQDIEGKELVNHLASIGRAVPFIIITGQGDERIAVDMMKRGALDYLVITDYDMPRLTGLDLATQTRLAGMRLPIVLVSGSADALREPASSRLGLAARLPKPFGAETLVETVKQVLRITNSRGECAGA